MIIVNLSGGLGNQMLQYAFARNISHRLKTNLKYHFTNSLFATQRNFGMDIFNIPATPASHDNLKDFGIFENRIINRVLYNVDERFGIQFNSKIITEKYPYEFKQSYFDIRDCSYIQGYWADLYYFKDIEIILKKEFTLQVKLDQKNLKMLDLIKSVNSISIHVRRTDYVKHFVGEKYYFDGIERFSTQYKKPHYFVFSDDLDWCKEKFSKTSNVHFIEHNKSGQSYKDMILMSNCKHNIVGNSTFSMWAAWLNPNKDRIVVAPNNKMFKRKAI